MPHTLVALPAIDESATIGALAGSLARVFSTRRTDATWGYHAAGRRTTALLAKHRRADHLDDTVRTMGPGAHAELTVTRRARLEERIRRLTGELSVLGLEAAEPWTAAPACADQQAREDQQ